MPERPLGEALDKLEEEDSLDSSEVAATWNASQENLLASIADRANCYRWMHNRCHTTYDRWNFLLTVPSIAVSAIAGSATLGLPSLIPDMNYNRLASIGIGLLTLSTGVLQSVNQYMKSAQLAEAHRIAAVAYGKLHCVVSSELALRRDQRLPAADFIKAVRAEQDRLQDTSPNILERVVLRFKAEFAGNHTLEKPEIAGDLDHVQVNRSVKAFHAQVTPMHTPLLIPSSSNSSTTSAT